MEKIKQLFKNIDWQLVSTTANSLVVLCSMLYVFYRIYVTLTTAPSVIEALELFDITMLIHLFAVLLYYHTHRLEGVLHIKVISILLAVVSAILI